MGKKAALVTGAGTRVGRAIALALAEDGWDIAIHYRNSKREATAVAASIKKMGGRSVLVRADLTDEKELKKIFPAAKALGEISLLVNNAAAFERDNLKNFSRKSWQAHLDTNLYAPLVLAREFAKQCKGEGQVINLVDGCAGWSISENFLSYSVSKLGLENITRLLARSLAPKIRINAIALGPTLPGKLDKKDTFAKLARMAPLQRLSSVEEVCDTVKFLLQAPSVTGQVISLSSGLSAP